MVQSADTLKASMWVDGTDLEVVDSCFYLASSITSKDRTVRVYFFNTMVLKRKIGGDEEKMEGRLGVSLHYYTDTRLQMNRVNIVAATKEAKFVRLNMLLTLLATDGRHV